MIETGRFSSTVDEPEPEPPPEAGCSLELVDVSPRLTTVSAKCDRPDGEKNDPKKPSVSFEMCPTSVNGAARCGQRTESLVGRRLRLDAEEPVAVALADRDVLGDRLAVAADDDRALSWPLRGTTMSCSLSNESICSPVDRHDAVAGLDTGGLRRRIPSTRRLDPEVVRLA